MNNTFDSIYTATVKATEVSQPWFLASLVWNAAFRVANAYTRTLQLEEDVTKYSDRFEQSGSEADAAAFESARENLRYYEEALSNNGAALAWWFKAYPIDLEDVVRRVCDTPTKTNMDSESWDALVKLMGVDPLSAADKVSKKEKELGAKLTRIVKDHYQDVLGVLKQYAGQQRIAKTLHNTVAAWASIKLAEKTFAYQKSLAKVAYWATKYADSAKNSGKKLIEAEKRHEATCAADEVRMLNAYEDEAMQVMEACTVWIEENRLQDGNADIDHGIARVDVNYL